MKVKWMVNMIYPSLIFIKLHQKVIILIILGEKLIFFLFSI